MTNKITLKTIIEWMGGSPSDCPVNFIMFNKGEREFTVTLTVEKALELFQRSIDNEYDEFGFLNYPKIEYEYDIRSRECLITFAK